MTATASKGKTAEEKAAIAARRAEIETREKELNASRTGKGTRVSVGLTRGKNPRMVEFEAFDEELPDTLPKSLSEFMELSKVSDETVIVSYLIDGYNSASYANASDETNEFVEASWPSETQKQFKAVVKNYASALDMEIADAVTAIKPNFVAGLAKLAAAKTTA